MMDRSPLRLAAKATATLAIWAGLSILVPPALASGPKNHGPNARPSSAGWQDDFSGSGLSKKIWVVASGQAPGYRAGDHIGYYDPGNVKLVSDSTGSYLRLQLTQQTGTVDGNTAGYVSHGALVYTKSKYGYGTYEWRMRMSSTSSTPTGEGDSVSGSVSAGFVYVNNSQTEIDFEFSGAVQDTLYMVNWLNSNPQSDPTDANETYTYIPLPSVSTDFHDYKFVWQPDEIDFYVDNVLQGTHTTNVPSAPAYFMINHWGTDNSNWGGSATVGPTRYFYVDWVKYTPLQ
jgi:beta-glucanase (GH16 family)